MMLRLIYVLCAMMLSCFAFADQEFSSLSFHEEEAEDDEQNDLFDLNWTIVDTSKCELDILGISATITQFEHADEDLELTITNIDFEESILKEITFEDLEKQIPNYVKKKSHDYSLVEFLIDYEEEKDEDVVRILPVPYNIEKVNIQGHEFMKVTFDVLKNTITIHISENYSTNIASTEPTTYCMYLLLEGKKLHIAEFCAPKDLYTEYEPFFQDTISTNLD